MSEKTQKTRTSMTINPGLFSRAKLFCDARSQVSGTKMSFSELVETALEKYLEENK